jgi:predicted AAA+ superfamily ATPase
MCNCLVSVTLLVHEFGKEFKYFISLNLEKQHDKSLFDNFEQTKDTVEAVFLRSGVPFTDELTLILIDEIQESPKAMSHLRFLCEEYPGFIIIAAGSLLEFALKEIDLFPGDKGTIRRQVR